MNSNTLTPDFCQLLTHNAASTLLAKLEMLDTQTTNDFQQATLNISSAKFVAALDNNSTNLNDNEQPATDCLIKLFNSLFAKQQVQLVRGEHEPEYFPAINDQPARIEFAHGFFASALHEASHWCVAGKARRQLPDFGYWYAADGRSATQQQAFERVEIKPQALECLFTLACQRPFQVSQDNFFANFDTSTSTFAHDVYNQAAYYINKPEQLPADAKTLLRALLTICIIK
jgi:elongation factor P hydroxylase